MCFPLEGRGNKCSPKLVIYCMSRFRKPLKGLSPRAMSREKESLITKLLGTVVLAFLLPIILPLALIVLTLYLTHRLALYVLIWLLWLPRGKNVLYVYSDSPIWRDYMTSQVLPLVQKRAVVLNWSERRLWPKTSFSAHVLRSFGGEREFNPLVVVFHPFRSARVFRFWPAFKDWKHGHHAPLENLRDDLMRAL